ncbi:hypothetical protein IMZ48_44605 [Candidatus Bathyarchaeota archaeon]|nr:hypothetical protein [Candidatus Bathyarchaeota archaeon]
MAPVLVFTLSEEGVSALRDVLVCLNKFNEEICLEARKDQVWHVPLVWQPSINPRPTPISSWTFL